MKRKSVTIYSVFAVATYILAIAYFCTALASEYKRSSLRTEESFRLLTNKFAKEISSGKNGDFSAFFSSFLDSHDRIAELSLQENDAYLFMYPKNPLPDSRYLRNFSYSYSDGEKTYSISAKMYLISPYSIFNYGKRAFMLILAVTLMTLLLLALVQDSPSGARKIPQEADEKSEDSEKQEPAEGDGQAENSEPAENDDAEGNLPTEKSIAGAENIAAEEEVSTGENSSPAENASQTETASTAELSSQEENASEAENVVAENVPESEADAQTENVSKTEVASSQAAAESEGEGNPENATKSQRDEAETAAPANESAAEEKASEENAKPAESALAGENSPAEEKNDNFEQVSFNTTLSEHLRDAIANEREFAIFVIKILGIERTSEEHRRLVELLEDRMKAQNLVFEGKGDSLILLKQDTSLDENLTIAENTVNEIENVFADFRPLCYVGISNRSLRIVTGERLLFEAEAALEHAEQSEEKVIAFRANAEQYNDFMNQS